MNEKVEDWLELLAIEMRATLATRLNQCLAAKNFTWDFPSQIICLAQQVKFTDDCEAAIEEGSRALAQLKEQLTTNLHELTSQDLSAEPLVQLKMKSLVLDLVHNIDVLDQLLKAGTKRLSDWQWRKQLRYYVEKGKAGLLVHWFLYYWFTG